MSPLLAVLHTLVSAAARLLAKLACRRCWGLTYRSRTLRNYKPSLWGGRTFAAMFGTTQRAMALDQAETARRERHAQCVARWAERRNYLRDV